MLRTGSPGLYVILKSSLHKHTKDLSPNPQYPQRSRTSAGHAGPQHQRGKQTDSGHFDGQPTETLNSNLKMEGGYERKHLSNTQRAHTPLTHRPLTHTTSDIYVLPWGLCCRCWSSMSVFLPCSGENPFATVKLRPTVTNDRSAPIIR